MRANGARSEVTSDEFQNTLYGLVSNSLICDAYDTNRTDADACINNYWNTANLTAVSTPDGNARLREVLRLKYFSRNALFSERTLAVEEATIATKAYSFRVDWPTSYSDFGVALVVEMKVVRNRLSRSDLTGKFAAKLCGVDLAQGFEVCIEQTIGEVKSDATCVDRTSSQNPNLLPCFAECTDAERAMSFAVDVNTTLSGLYNETRWIQGVSDEFPDPLTTEFCSVRIENSDLLIMQRSCCLTGLIPRAVCISSIPAVVASFQAELA